MLSIFKKLFKKDELTADHLFQDEASAGDRCHKCNFGEDYNCPLQKENDKCKWGVDLPKDFIKGNDTILLIDDNAGMVSFLTDDMKFIGEQNHFDLQKTNILPISTSFAAFNFNALQTKNDGLNIKYALIDITLGGSVMTKNGNVKYTGVDVYAMILKYNPDVKFLFYTGNNLNPYIKANKILIDQFNEINGGKINDFVLFKTSMDLEARRDYIVEKLFK